MKEPVYIKLFLDYLDAVDALSDVERGRLFTALLKYGRTGEAPQLTGNERFIFPLMKAQIDRDFAAWREKDEDMHEIRKEAGRKGGLARASKAKQNQANQANASKAKQTKQTKQTKHKTKTTDNDERLLTNDTPPIPPSADNAEAVAAAGYDPAYGEVMAALRDFIPEASEIAYGEMTAFYQELGRDICLRAIFTARDERKSGFSYIRGILRRCQKEGIRTLADWDRAAREKEARSETARARDEPDKEAPSYGFKCLSD